MPRPSTRTTARRATASVTRAFLFSDLRGYTDFVEAHGDSAAADLLHSYRAIVRSEVERLSGAEVKTEGDSFYVVFESPSGALDCAVAIQRAALEHGGADHPKELIRIGIGLHAGETVPYDDQFVGSAVNIAARLTSKAKAGEIIVSDTFRGLVRTAVRYEMEDRGPLRLKGLTERVRAWSVEWREAVTAPSAPAPTVEIPLSSSSTIPGRTVAPGQIVCPVLVGRDAERARFAEHLHLAATGRGQAAIVAGEAGVGKSAFVRDAVSSAEHAGFRVLYGATLESDSGLPYAPFVAAVRSGFRGLAHDRLGRVLTQAAPDLAQLFPELGKAQRGASTAAVEHHRLSVAFLGLFTTFAREGPVLLVVEDLHWADEASLGLFHYLARELSDARVLLLGTYRSDEMHRRHPLLRILASMQRERSVSEMALQRLDREQVRALIHETFVGTDPDLKITDEFVDAIHSRSEGNPFFTEELLKSLVDSGGLFFEPGKGWGRKPLGELRIPGSVLESVRARIDRLSPGAQETASAAAVIGLRVPFDVLRDVRGIGEADVESHLRELIEQQLMIELGGDEDEYGFRHALTKEVVYDDLLVRERKRLHRGVSEALSRDTTSEPALIAHHLIAAGDGTAAVPHLLAAAERAARAYAPRDAAGHYEKAVEIGVPDDRLATTLERLAETYYLFDFARSRKAADESATVYRQHADVRGVSRMLRLASRNIWQQSDPDTARELAKEAIAVLDGLEPTPELGRATAHLAQLEMTAAALDDAVVTADRALELGRRFGDPWTVANALITKASAIRTKDRAAARKLMDEGIELAKKNDLAETAVRGYNNLLASVITDPDERVRVLDEGVAYGERHGLEQPMLQSQRAFSALLRGEWDRAVALSLEVPPGSSWHSISAWVRAWVVVGRQGPGPAIDLIGQIAETDAARREVQRSFAGLAVLPFFYVLHGDRAAAADRFARLRLRAEEDPGYYIAAATGWGGAPILLGAAFDDATWLDRIEERLPLDPESRDLPAHACQVARTLMSRDPRRAAEVMAEWYEHARGRKMHHTLGFQIVFSARDVLRRGLALGGEWRPIFDSAISAAPPDAPWLRGELATLNAAIVDPA